MRRIEKLALVSVAPPRELDNTLYNPDDKWPGYGIRRIQADVVAAGWADHIDIQVFEFRADEIEQLHQAIEAYNPDFIGGAAYIWSFEILVELAKFYKSFRPDGLVLLGGPSARTCMMDLEPFHNAGDYVDAMCIGEGEGVMPDILKKGCTKRQDFVDITGLAVAQGEEWIETPSRPLITDLDVIASPYQLGLMPEGTWGYLESFRGCPMTCSFCEWGVSGPTNRMFTRDYMAREMQAMLDSGIHPGIFQLDAGLNLNAKAFREFAAASYDTNFFDHTMLYSHIYPSHLKDEHMEFLERCKVPVIGLGLQAFDQGVLKSHSRPAKIENFERVAHELASVCYEVEIQILFALPGDTPKTFMNAVEFALDLPAQIRIFHTLVLPDALMTRSLPEHDVYFNPYTLKVMQAQGWSEKEIEQTARELDRMVEEDNGGKTDLWWSLNSRRTRSIVAPH